MIILVTGYGLLQRRSQTLRNGSSLEPRGSSWRPWLDAAVTRKGSGSPPEDPRAEGGRLDIGEPLPSPPWSEAAPRPLVPRSVSGNRPHVPTGVPPHGSMCSRNLFTPSSIVMTTALLVGWRCSL